MEFVESTEGRLRLHFLPPYSPELNPDEWVWKNVKHDNVGKMASRSIVEMRNGVEKIIKKLESSADIIRGFFLDPDLSYVG
jgi:transposase